MLQNDFVQLQCIMIAFQDMVPNVARNECHFHWTQAISIRLIRRKVQDLGLGPGSLCHTHW